MLGIMKIGEKMNKYYFENKDKTQKILVEFYSEDIVRFCYGEKKSISDAIIMKASEVNIEKSGNLLKTKSLEIFVDENLCVEIYDKEGNLLSEDLEYNFHKEEKEKTKVENLVNIEDTLKSESKNKIYGAEHKRKHLWEKAYYGMGEKYGFINLLNRYTENWNTDVLGFTPAHQSMQRTYHTSIPFYIGLDEDKSYGIFYDTTYKTYFDFAKKTENISFKSEGDNLDYYFVYGPKISDVVEKYSKLTGTMKLPRKDFLGYQQCRWSYMDIEEVLFIAREMRKNKIPCDVIYLDINYMEDFKVFTFDSKRFREFKKMTEELHSMGFKLVVIIDPGVKVEKDYEIYEEGMEKDCFVKDEKGEVYVGKVWPGDSVFPDFMQEKVRIWWGELHKGLIEQGVDGIWNDMNEPSDMSTFSKTLPEECYHIDDQGKKRLHKEIHNIYAHYESKASYKALKNNQGTRPFLLTRAASAGTQRYTALWTGDNASLWEHLEGSIPMILNLGLSGFSYVGSDIGGFLDDADKELIVRWFQLGIFYPLCRNHSTLNSFYQEPWRFGEKNLEIIRNYISLRYELMDYIYNLFWESSLKGSPIMRPLFYHYQDENETFNINDQFLFGQDMMVAPIVRPKTETRLVYFPKGNWINYFTGKVYEGGKYHICQAKLNELLLFVREGAIVLKNEIRNYISSETLNKEIHLYYGQDNEKVFYFDDGISFNYKKGEFSKLNIKSSKSELLLEKINNNFGIGKIDLVIHKDSEKIIYENLIFDEENVCRISLVR